MKCDELKPLVFSLKDFAYIDESAVKKNFENPHDHAVYKATEVDAAIDELKTEIERITLDKRNQEMRADLAEAACTEYRLDYKQLAESQRWRKVDEELPTKDDANESGKLLGYLCGYGIVHEYCWTDVQDKLYGITHWMPLPKFEEK